MNFSYSIMLRCLLKLNNALFQGCYRRQADCKSQSPTYPCNNAYVSKVLLNLEMLIFLNCNILSVNSSIKIFSPSIQESIILLLVQILYFGMKIMSEIGICVNCQC